MKGQAQSVSEQIFLKFTVHVLFMLAHFVFLGCPLLVAYAFLTCNLNLILLLLTISGIQIFIKRNQFFIHLLRKYMNLDKYFNSFKIIDDTQQTSKSEKSTVERCIFGFHPHSVYAVGLLFSMNQEQHPCFAKMVGLSSNFALNFPIFGALFKMWGMRSASNESIKQLMRDGKNIALLPGGFQQATITTPKELRCWITKRKGFIKYALEYDYAICPVIVLGQHEAFQTLDSFKSWRLMANKIKIPGVIFWNKLTGIIMPKNIDITVIKGNPIRYSLGNQKEPSKELIDQAHQAYMEEVQRLYAKYQHLNGKKPLRFY